MATIFQKISGDNCVILGPKEALVYPFSMGSWTEIRVGGYFSYTNINDNNLTGIKESFSSSGPPTAFFWGIKDTGTNLPYSSGSVFFGITNDSVGSPKSVLNNYTLAGQSPYAGTSDNSNNSVAYFTFLSGNSLFRTSSQLNGGGFYALRMTEGTFVTGTTGYAWFNGLRYLYDRNRSIITGAAMQSSSPSTDISITGLRTLLSQLPNQSTLPASNISGCGIQPDALFLYNPLINNQIRIHGLAVEKYQ